jgi:hypothetical protein
MIATTMMLVCSAGRTEPQVAIEKAEVAPGIYLFSTAPDGYVPNGNSLVIINGGQPAPKVHP